MSTIKNFKQVFEDDSYDRVRNLKGLNVKQLSPIGISWNDDEHFHQIIDKDNKVFSEKFDNYHIIVIIAPFEQDIEKNKAYLLNSIGEVVIDFRKILREKFDNQFYYFSDVYMENSELFLIVHFRTQDFKFQYKLNNGIYNFQEIKW